MGAGKSNVHDASDEEEAVDERVGVGAGEEEDGERREEEVDEGETEAGEHGLVGWGARGRLRGFWRAVGHGGGWLRGV